MEVKMSRTSQTKKGVAAIYVVVFTTMLIGIITLSFLRIMLSESGRTLNDTLSDSAYNAALAGVEDAKYVIARYQQEIAAGKTSTDSKIVEQLESKTDNNCDIISDALELTKNNEYSVGTNDSGQTFQDQAYTCVMIDLSGDFKGVLSTNNPTLVVPLKPSGKDADKVDNVAGVKITWTMGSDDISSFTGSAVKKLHSDFGKGIVNNVNALKDDDAHNILGRKGVMDNDNQVALNGLRVMLVQSPKDEPNPDYYSSESDGSPEDSPECGRTNRGTLMLLASSDEGSKNEFTACQFVRSADKNLNAPLGVRCNPDSCTATLKFPKPKGGDGSRNPDNFFLVLNQLYSEPSIKVTVNMINSEGKPIDFFNVQPIVDATGRSGDLFRRVEARIGTDNGASLVPTAELSTNSAINKDFPVTKNCIDGTEACD